MLDPSPSPTLPKTPLTMISGSGEIAPDGMMTSSVSQSSEENVQKTSLSTIDRNGRWESVFLLDFRFVCLFVELSVYSRLSVFFCLFTRLFD